MSEEKVDIVEHWMPVLEKCDDIKEHLYQPFAQLIDNQYHTWTGDTMANISDFTAFCLPIVRRTLVKLDDIGFSIEPITIDDPRIDDLKIEHLIEIPEAEYVEEEFGDVESLIESLTDKISMKLLNRFPDKVFRPYLLMVPVPPIDVDFEELGLKPGINMAVYDSIIPIYDSISY